MKAVICTNYGPPEVLKIKEVKKPVPADHEVLIKIHATTAHVGDTRIRRADPFLVRLMFGLFKPRKNLILGIEASGTIEAVGHTVKSLQAGDEVFALTGFGLGGYAAYICLPEKVKAGTQERKGLVIPKPTNLSFNEAATVPAGGLTALKNLQKANISHGKKILINGASGSLGTYAIQLAKYYGAEVTAVCSGKNFGLVKFLGADYTIDYTQEDFTKRPEKYDIVYDAVMKSKRAKCRKILNRKGIFVNNNHLPKIQEADLWVLKDLIERGFVNPVIDRIYAMDEVVEAHRYVDQGHKKGNVVITIKDE
jgi:NADPH:quinone reductase-like Zn-dependent oxidoreductase